MNGSSLDNNQRFNWIALAWMVVAVFVIDAVVVGIRWQWGVSTYWVPFAVIYLISVLLPLCAMWAKCHFPFQTLLDESQSDKDCVFCPKLIDWAEYQRRKEAYQKEKKELIPAPKFVNMGCGVWFLAIIGMFVCGLIGMNDVPERVLHSLIILSYGIPPVMVAATVWMNKKSNKKFPGLRDELLDRHRLNCPYCNGNLLARTMPKGGVCTRCHKQVFALANPGSASEAEAEERVVSPSSKTRVPLAFAILLVGVMVVPIDVIFLNTLDMLAGLPEPGRWSVYGGIVILNLLLVGWLPLSAVISRLRTRRRKNFYENAYRDIGSDAPIPPLMSTHELLEDAIRSRRLWRETSFAWRMLGLLVNVSLVLAPVLALVSSASISHPAPLSVTVLLGSQAACLLVLGWWIYASPLPKAVAALYEKRRCPYCDSMFSVVCAFRYHVCNSCKRTVIRDDEDELGIDAIECGSALQEIFEANGASDFRPPLLERSQFGPQTEALNKELDKKMRLNDRIIKLAVWGLAPSGITLVVVSVIAMQQERATSTPLQTTVLWCVVSSLIVALTCVIRRETCRDKLKRKFGLNCPYCELDIDIDATDSGGACKRCERTIVLADGVGG